MTDPKTKNPKFLSEIVNNIPSRSPLLVEVVNKHTLSLYQNKTGMGLE